MAETSIEWTNKVWNPTRGCSRISPGCGDGTPELVGKGGCYAERMGARLCGPGRPYEGLIRLGKNGPRWTGKMRLAHDMLPLPLRWKKPRRIFVNSMSDLFHEGLTNEEIAVVFAVMAGAHRHTFQVLTKRAERMRKWFEWVSDEPHSKLAAALDRAGFDEDFVAAVANWVSGFSRWKNAPADGNPLDGSQPRWPLPNVHLGVSVENQKYADKRIPQLLDTPAVVRWISAEPLLGPLEISEYLDGEYAPKDFGGAAAEEVGPRLSWVVVGGESGPSSRPYHVDWARELIAQCRDAAVPIFHKQLGASPHDRISNVESWPLPDSRFHGLPNSDDVVVFIKDKKGGDPEEWPEALRIREWPEVSR
ncbi:MAG: phage Gp37/Gp68 family protein [Polyangiaceae bacterium]|nr:phage Gp37/Gp68 family protein [Polyangiaceae bacterium]